MILSRLGNKKMIAKDIIKHFPEHRTYIEPFFGAGGLYFNKPKAQYNILNDLDSDVYNLYNVLQQEPEKFRTSILDLMETQDLYKYWIKHKETEPIKKAIRFIYLSNWGYLGRMGCMSLQTSCNKKQLILERLDITIEALKHIQITNLDCIKMLKSICFKGIVDVEKSFVYCDPPYINTENNYSNSFSETNLIELLEKLIDMKVKFAISEFKNDKTLEIANKYNLNVIDIRERITFQKYVRTEILMTNYIHNKKPIKINEFF